MDRDERRALFARRLRAVMERQGWSRARLAAALSMPKDTLERWLEGHQVPLVPRLLELAAVLHVAPRYLTVTEWELAEYRRKEREKAQERQEPPVRRPVNVQLTREQVDWLFERAGALGIGVSEYLRALVDEKRREEGD